jgi:AcrR family transcriptional regulator
MKDSKDKILSIAYGLFLQKTFKEVTMEEIVKKSGLSKGAFYHHFESKQQVFIEALEHFLLSSMEHSLQGLSKTSLYDFYNGYLATMAQRTLRFGADQPISEHGLNFFNLIFDGMRLFPELQAKLAGYLKAEQKTWEDIISVARKSGEIKSAMTDEQIARLFISTGDGSVMMNIMGEQQEKANQELKILWNGLYNQLKA